MRAGKGVNLLDTVKTAGGRRSKSKELLKEFLDAAIDCAYELGIDRVPVSKVAQAAKSSRPTFYSLFGSIQGLYAEIWVKYGSWFLGNLANPGYRLEVAPDEEHKRMRVLLEIFTVSRRMSEVAEVVEPSVADWWSAQTKGDTFSELKFAWLVGQKLGSWLTFPVESKALLAGIVVPVIQSLGTKPSSKASPVEQSSLPTLTDPQIADTKIDSQLLDATVRVIARDGVENASISRVSRFARVTTGAIYPRYKKLEDLIEASFERAISDVVQQNFNSIQGTKFTPDDFGLITAAGLQPSRKTWRDFRVEMHVFARTSERLSARLKHALNVTNARVAEGLEDLPISKPERESVAYLVHAIGIGLAILLNAKCPVNELDHRLITRDMIQVLALR